MLQQCGWLHGSAVRSRQVTRPPVCAFQPREDAGVGQPRVRIDRRRAPAAELRLDRHAAHERGLQGIEEDVADLVVVDPQRGGHGQGGEDPGRGEPLDRPLLDPPQVGAAVVAVGLQAEAVELQVDLDALAVRLQEGEQAVVLGDLDAVAC